MAPQPSAWKTDHDFSFWLHDHWGHGHGKLKYPRNQVLGMVARQCLGWSPHHQAKPPTKGLGCARIRRGGHRQPKPPGWGTSEGAPPPPTLFYVFFLILMKRRWIWDLGAREYAKAAPGAPPGQTPEGRGALGAQELGAREAAEGSA